MKKDIIEIVEELCTKEGEYPVKNTKINGYSHKCFDWGPSNLGEYFSLALEHEERDMLVFEGKRWTYREAYLEASSFANALINRYQIQKNDKVAIASRNFPEWMFSFMAITSIGAVAVPLNSWWTTKELEYGLKNCDAKLVIVDRERLERINPFAEKLKLNTILLRAKNNPNGDLWEDLLNKYSDLEMPKINIDKDQDATIFYTSGSTGHPKGVCSSHRAILSALLQWMVVGRARTIRDSIEEDDSQPSCLITVPLFHVTGSHAQFMLSFLSARKMVMMYRWDPEEALKLIEAEKITSISGVPTMTLEVMRSEQRKNYDLSSLKELSGGGAARPTSHVQQLQDEFPNTNPGLGYGLTETNAAGAVISGEEYLLRPGSTGKPTPPLTEIKIVKEDGQQGSRDEVGEVYIKSSTNFRCYWRDKKATREAFDKEWFKTGDLGYLDEESYLFIVDRAKDIVIRGGENISCLEVEDIINSHPSIIEASVYGIPDERLGEVLCSSISVKKNIIFDQKEFKNYLKKYLAAFKIPEHIDEHYEMLPRTASGKIYKLKLRETMKEYLT